MSVWNPWRNCGIGPWVGEPDEMQYSDPKTGLACLIRRHAFAGHLCGYVGVSEGHPLYRVDHRRIRTYIDVHGKLSFSDFCNPDGERGTPRFSISPSGEPDNIWWLGFHCSQELDLIPSRSHWRRPDEWLVYRDIDYVRGEVAKLARQLSEVKEFAILRPTGDIEIVLNT